ncbi:MAG: ABC transporter permease [Actinobacteria bacterium]|nr:ABC transporter permease [Actinomycetota bacterium]
MRSLPVRCLRPGWGVVPIILLLALWEVVPRVSDGSGGGLLPPFSEVMVEGWRLLGSGVLADNFLSSLVRVLAGFVAGAITGVGLGVIMGWRENVRKTLRPLISLFYPIPAVGWIPLLMLWIGINDLLPIVIIYICSFFPVLYTTISGVRSVDRDFIRVARSLGASERHVLLTVVIPLALPYIFTGLRLEAGMAWRVLAAAEMIAVPTGLGALMMRAQSLIRIDIIIVCLIVLSVMCLLFEKLFAVLESRLTRDWC